MLGRPFSELQAATADKPATLSFGGGGDEVYTADCLIHRKVPPIGGPIPQVHRALLVLNSKIALDLAASPKTEDEDDEEEAEGAAKAQQAESSLFVLPPGCLSESCPAQPIFALMAGEGTFSAPTGQCEMSLLRCQCPND